MMEVIEKHATTMLTHLGAAPFTVGRFVLILLLTAVSCCLVRLHESLIPFGLVGPSPTPQQVHQNSIIII